MDIEENFFNTVKGFAKDNGLELTDILGLLSTSTVEVAHALGTNEIEVQHEDCTTILRIEEV